MNISKIGKRYAKALFTFAIEQKDVEKVMADMELVDNTIKQSRELRKLLDNPVIHNRTKKAALKAVFENYVGETVLKYLMIIVQKNREAFIPQIAHQYVVYYKEHNNIKTARLSTAQPVSNELRNAVLRTLEEQTQAEVELIEEIKAELIGGLVLKVEDMEMDLSLRKRLNELSQNFKHNIYQGKF